jgi:S-formylglutathione hydrolase FrmB
MPFIQASFSSNALGHEVQANVILPERGNVDAPLLRVLWLLHGSGDDHTIWQRLTSIERYAAPLGIAVVMPAVQRSYYTNMAHGQRYFDYVADELPRLMRGFFHFSDRREDNFVAGLSMGGYGAFKLALTYPERYAAAASLSGALDIVALVASRTQGANASDEWIKFYTQIFGSLETLPNSENDLLHLLKDSQKKQLPKLYACCGTEDFLYADNITFRDLARQLGADLTYFEEAGEHEWGFWDCNIQKVLNWIPLQ